jgi:hypothetical protein
MAAFSIVELAIIALLLDEEEEESDINKYMERASKKEELMLHSLSY